MAKELTILHCDANNFYASAEILINPELKNKPVAVCGDPKKRHGIILAKNDLAKKCGVSTGEVIWMAQQKCPDLVLLPPHYSLYEKLSRQLFEIYKQYTDRVEPFGIDECWLDVTESLKLFGDGKTIADNLRKEIKEKIGLTISVGVSFTKVFAKLGSDIKKPDATTVISSSNYKEIVWSLPVENLIMIGKKTKELLRKLNVNTIGELAKFPKDNLEKKMGVIGARLIENANGVSDDPVGFYYTFSLPDSIGNSTTLPKDISTKKAAYATLSAIADLVSTRLRQHKMLASGMSVWVKFCNLESLSKQCKLFTPTNNQAELLECAISVFDKLYFEGSSLNIRALGISTHQLATDNLGVQFSFLQNNLERHNNMDKVIDKVRDKYGYDIIKTADILEYNELCEGVIKRKSEEFDK